MKVRDIIVESYADSLYAAIKDVAASLLAQDIDELDVLSFRKKLAEIGFVTNMKELTSAIVDAGFSLTDDESSVRLGQEDPESISADPESNDEVDPLDQLSLDDGSEMAADVSGMANSQAMKDVKGGLNV